MPRSLTYLAATATLALCIAGCGASAAVHPATASTAQIRAFLAEAEHGLGGSFSLTYDTTVGYGRGVARRVVVSVAQRSAGLFTYRTTPSLALRSPNGPAASYSYEVYAAPRAGGKLGAGIFSCSRRTASSRWVCAGPYTGIGMGGTQELLGPYAPRALVLGLENATVAYTGVPAPPATRHEPAFRTTERVSGTELQCLEFGSTKHRVGSVCLRPNGTVATYDLSQAVTFGAYLTASLRAASPSPSAAAFDLPAKPTVSAFTSPT